MKQINRTLAALSIASFGVLAFPAGASAISFNFDKIQINAGDAAGTVTFVGDDLGDDYVVAAPPTVERTWSGDYGKTKPMPIVEIMFRPEVDDEVCTIGSSNA